MNEVITFVEMILAILATSKMDSQSTVVALDIARLLYLNNNDKVNDVEQAAWLERFGLTLTTK